MNENRHIHFIAIGGSAMHNLAIALHKKGYNVTGSDDEIFEPSKGRLERYGLLPDSIGWNPERITTGTEAIILGMHARVDNPELAYAKKLGIKIFSYPEYLYEQSKEKTRVVIGGSHGKTSITSMVIHALNLNGIDCDYMVGAQLEGFEVMVKLSENGDVIVLEGDEYLTSPIDRRPKFHLYKPDIALLSGIAWDHINVFPTWENYIDQFRIFIDQIEPNGSLVYCEEDLEVKKLAEKAGPGFSKVPYGLLNFRVAKGRTVIIDKVGEYPIQVFGKHNILNINGAMQVCKALGVSEADFLQAMTSFQGSSNRLQLLMKNEDSFVFKDFAHSPSKLKATIEAVKLQYPDKALIACMELHTFSSLNKAFLPHYSGSMNAADKAIVYFNPNTVAHKRLEEITPIEVKNAFERNDLIVYSESKKLEEYIVNLKLQNAVLLIMSSGNFDGLDFSSIIHSLK